MLALIGVRCDASLMKVVVDFLALGVLGFLAAFGFLAALAALALAAAVALDLVELVDDFLVAAGILMILASPGVTSLVQYHLPSASAQDCPSLALA